MTGSVGWWRRNWWALVAVLPVLVVAVWLSPSDSYERWRTAQPRQALAPDADGWVDYGGSGLRLVGWGEADLRDFGGDPYVLPPGVRAWQATVEFRQLADPDESLLGCDFQLEDEDGRLFGDGPSELSGARLGPGGETHYGASCRPDDDEVTAATFQTWALFLLPISAEPVALRVAADDQLPAYVRFSLG